MSKLDISRFSDAYLTRRLSEDDIEEIYGLGLTNPQYYAHCGVALDRQTIARDLTLLPEGKRMEDKYDVGFYDAQGLLAVLDLVDGYPDDKTAYIGLFMVSREKSGRGIGSAVIEALCACLRSEGKAFVRLAYVKSNPQAAHFWTKNGFRAVREAENEYGRVVVAERALSNEMRK